MSHMAQNVGASAHKAAEVPSPFLLYIAKASDDTVETGGVPVPKEPAASVGSWEGDKEFFPRGKHGGGAPLLATAAATSSRPEQTNPQINHETCVQQYEIVDLCDRMVKNATENLRDRLHRHKADDEKKEQMRAFLEKDLAKEKERRRACEAKAAQEGSRADRAEEEMADMAKDAAKLRLEIRKLKEELKSSQQGVERSQRPEEQKQVVQQPQPHLNAPSGPQRSVTTGHSFNIAARPFQPPAQHDPQQPEPSTALVKVPRAAPPFPPAAQRELHPSSQKIPQRLLANSPAHADDIFDPSFPPQVSWRPAGFGKETITQLLSLAYGKVTWAVTQTPHVSLPGARLPGAPGLIQLGHDHTGKPRMTWEMLNNEPYSKLLLTGIVNHLLTERIFTSCVLLENPEEREGYVVAFRKLYADEQRIFHPHPRLQDYKHRRDLAGARAKAATNLQRLPHFWRWVGDKADSVTREITAKVQVGIAPFARAQFMGQILQATTELIRIHVRMCQEPCLYHFEYVMCGFPWVSERMVHRNPEMIGIHLSDIKSQWVSQSTVAPMLVAEKFEKKQDSEEYGYGKECVLKAEVTLCDRKGNLRA